MKKLTLISAIVAVTLSSTSMAADKYRHSDSPYYNDGYNQAPAVKIVRAKVIDVDPVYQTIQSRRQQDRREQYCWTEPRYSDKSDRRVGSIVGAVIGSTIGHSLGHKRSNKRVGAVAGAIIGSSIGKNVAKDKRRSETYCETRSNDYYDRGYRNSGYQELVGYNVTYKYKGNRFTSFMNRKPGRYLELEMSLRPLVH